MLRVIFWILLIYFVYKFIFDFLIPMGQVSKKMNEKMKQFQDQQAPNSGAQPPPAPGEPKAKAGEYIDFEEIKE